MEIPADEPCSFYGIPTMAVDEPSWLSEAWCLAQSNAQM